MITLAPRGSSRGLTGARSRTLRVIVVSRLCVYGLETVHLRTCSWKYSSSLSIYRHALTSTWEPSSLDHTANGAEGMGTNERHTYIGSSYCVHERAYCKTPVELLLSGLAKARL